MRNLNRPLLALLVGIGLTFTALQAQETSSCVAAQQKPVKAKRKPDRLKGMKAALADIEAGKLGQRQPPYPDSRKQQRYNDLLRHECGVEIQVVPIDAREEMLGYNDVMRIEIEYRFGPGILQKLAIRATQLEDGFRERRGERGHKTTAAPLAFSPDGRLLATYSNDAVRLWHVPTGTLVQHWTNRGKLPAEFRGLLAVTNDGKVSAAFVETGSTNFKGPIVPPDGNLHWAEVKLHDFTTGKVRVLARRTTPQCIPGIGANFSLLAFSPGGKALVISTFDPGGTQEVMLVDTATGKAHNCPTGFACVSEWEARLPAARIEVHVYPQKLTAQDKVSMLGTAVEITSETTLIWVDLQPDARFGHATELILISAEGTRVVKGMWWPTINGKDFRPHRPHADRIKGMKQALDDIGAGKLKLKWQAQWVPPKLHRLETLQEQIYRELLKKECGIETQIYNPLLALSEEARIAMKGYNDIMAMEIEHRFGAGILTRLSEKARELAAKQSQS